MKPKSNEIFIPGPSGRLEGKLILEVLGKAMGFLITV